MDTGQSALKDARVRIPEKRIRVKRPIRKPVQATHQNCSTANLAQGLSDFNLGGQPSCEKEPTNIIFGEKGWISESPGSCRSSAGAGFVDIDHVNNVNKKLGEDSVPVWQEHGASLLPEEDGLPPCRGGVSRDGMGGLGQTSNGDGRWARMQNVVFSTLNSGFSELNVDDEQPGESMNGSRKGEEIGSMNLGRDSGKKHSHSFHGFGETFSGRNKSACWVEHGRGSIHSKKRHSSEANDPFGHSGLENQGSDLRKKNTQRAPNSSNGSFRVPFTMGAQPQKPSSTTCKKPHPQKSPAIKYFCGGSSNLGDRVSVPHRKFMEDAGAHLASKLDGMRLNEDVQNKSSSRGAQCVGSGSIHESTFFETCLRTDVKVFHEGIQSNRGEDKLGKDGGEFQGSKASTSRPSGASSASFVHGKAQGRTLRKAIRQKSLSKQEAAKASVGSGGWFGTSLKHNENEKNTRIRPGDNSTFSTPHDKKTAYPTVENASWFGCEKKASTEYAEDSPYFCNGMHSVPQQGVHMSSFFTVPVDSSMSTEHNMDKVHKDMKYYYQENQARSSISSSKKHQKVMHSAACNSTVEKVVAMDVDDPVSAAPLSESQPSQWTEKQPSQYGSQPQFPPGVSSRRSKIKVKRSSARGRARGRRSASGVPAAGGRTPAQVGCSSEVKTSAFQDEGVEKSIREARNTGENFRKSANSLHIAQRYEEAEAMYTKGISTLKLCSCPKLESSLAALLSNRAASRLMLNRPQDALQDCEDAIAVDTNYVKAYLRYGTCCLKLAMFECGKSVLEKAASMLSVEDPNYSSIVHKGAEIDAAEQSCKELKAVLSSKHSTELAVEEVIRKANSLYTMATHSELVSAILACILLRAKKYKEGLKHVETSIRLLNIETLGDKVQIWWCWVRLQLYWQVQGETDKALEETKQLLRAMEGSGLTEFNCPLNIGCKVSAEELQSFIANMSQALGQKELGNKQVKQGSYKLAIESYQKALMCCNDCGAPAHIVAVLHSNRGSAYYGLKKYVEAIGDCSRARALLPGQYHVLYHIGSS